MRTGEEQSLHPYGISPDEGKASTSQRLLGLDGLRGLAALAVMFYHLALMFPSIADAHGVDGEHSAPWSPTWWLTSTPGHIIIAGPAAVLVFFVLSGVVVTLPVIRNASFDWMAYFPQRAARLGLPAVASVLLAAVFVVLGNAFSAEPSGSMATNWSARTFEFGTFIQSTDVLLGSPILNNALWTLRYELIFSFMLPIFVVVALAAKRYWAANLIICSIVIVIGHFNQAGGYAYLPIFMIGCVIAVQLTALQSWVARPSSAVWVRWGAPLVLAASVFLITLHASVWEILPGKGRVQQWSVYFEFLGAVGLVLVAALWAPAAKFLSTAVLRWLGRISFSLYLIHMPLLVLVDRLIGPDQTILKVVITAVLAFVLAELFCRFVEQPLHRLSRSIGVGSSRVWQRTFAAPRP